jgi:hypothetical protein
MAHSQAATVASLEGRREPAFPHPEQREPPGI